MSTPQTVIGLCGGLCPAPFLQALNEKLLLTTDSKGSKVAVQTVKLEWTAPKSDKPLVVQGDRKIRAFDEALYLINDGCKVIGLPNFGALTFLDELQTELTTPIANIGVACAKALPKGEPVMLGYLGVPETDKAKAVIKSFEGQANVNWVFLSEGFWPNINKYHDLMEQAQQGADTEKEAFELLQAACKNLLENGAALIQPTCGYQAVACQKLSEFGIPMLDVIEAYADYLAKTDWHPLPKPFKVGLVGGLGPAATVDLYDKITKATPAKNDQEHFKVAIEQNPQIADRTAYLLHGGYDPTLSLYAVCKRLESDGVDAIIIPCNTAHAYFDTIVPHLSVPLINMQQTALEEIRDKLGQDVVIGLLATDGTVATGIYHNKAKAMGFSIVAPDKEFQAMVMEAIYGPKGVKAGFTDGECKASLLRAAEHLAKDKGARALILGCTELPLILSETLSFDLNGVNVAFVDPTASLARKVVEVAQEITKERGRR